MRKNILGFALLVFSATGAVLSNIATAAPVLTAHTTAISGTDGGTSYNFSTATEAFNQSSANFDGGGAETLSYVHSSGAYWLRGIAGGPSSQGAMNTGFLQTVTNLGTVAQNYQMTFTIYRGQISFSDRGFGVNPGESLAASFLAQILRNGTSIWQTSASVTNNAGSAFSGTGGYDLNYATNLSNSGGDAQISWETQTVTALLGSLNPGQSMTIDAQIGALISSNMAVYSEWGCDCSYGNTGSAQIGYSDPGEISGTPYEISVANDVPEPGAISLFGLGLLLAFTVRARQRLA